MKPKPPVCRHDPFGPPETVTESGSLLAARSHSKQEFRRVSLAPVIAPPPIRTVGTLSGLDARLFADMRVAAGLPDTITLDQFTAWCAKEPTVPWRTRWLEFVAQRHVYDLPQIPPMKPEIPDWRIRLAKLRR